MKYKVGDKVRYVVKRDIDNVKVGEVGIIRGISSYGNYAVDFEESGYRHNCDGLCQSNHGWWCIGDTLEPVDNKTFEVKEVIKETEEKKMPTKFTFYTVDASRINKTNNTKVDTIMTCVHIGDKVGYATCDKEDYDEREGILNAIANLCCDGSFDKAYRKAVKEKKISETLDCTCSYCRKVFDTVEERQEHEAWHIECRKARHQRYLLRKRAKEIAFEEQAQKMAKEIIAEDNKK